MVNLTPEEIRRRLLGEQPRLREEEEDDEDDGGGGLLGFLGRAAGDTLSEVTNAGEFFGRGLERLTLGQVSGGDVARLTGLSRAPEPVRDFLNIAAAPATIAAASPATNLLSQGLRQSPRLITRGVGHVIQPFPLRSPVARLGLEAGAGTVGETVTREAQERGVPTPAAVTLGIASGGLTAGGLTAASTRGGRSGIRDLTRRPDRVSVRPTQVEEGVRKGNLLRAKTADQLAAERRPTAQAVEPDAEAPTYTVRDVLKHGNQLELQANSQVNRVVSAGELGLSKLGKPTRDSTGNLTLPHIRDADGNPAYLQEVVEFPDRFILTAEQEQGVRELSAAFRSVRNERDLFGVPPLETDLELGQNFISRLATTDTKGTPLGQTVRDAPGRRPSSPIDRSRRFLDPREGIDAGVVYEHPTEALRRYAQRGLKLSVDAHLNSLLTPLSESALMYVPQPLRQRHDVLSARLRGLQGTLRRLDEETSNVISAYLHSAEPNMDALAEALKKVRVGASAAGRRGRNFGKTADEVRAEVRAVRQEIDKMRPQWRQAIREARRTVPAGRATVPHDINSELSGRNFSLDDARAITRWYSRGAVPATDLGTGVQLLRKGNQAIIPLRAVGDTSALFNQLGAIATTNPRIFAKNAALAFRDAVDFEHYERFIIEQGEDFAAHGGAILGRVGRQSDFEFGSWVERVPVLRELQRHFQAVTTRVRIDIYNSIVDTAAKSGNPLDDAAKEQVARSLNRLTGVANSRAGDLETLGEFAPNYMRSTLETVASAALDGTIEGQIARQYMRNLLVAGQLMAVGAALSQGRDVREVTNPIDVNALKRGDIRLNSNFGTVRVAGQDVSLYGRFDSLARLLAVATDASVGAISEQELRVLGDAIGYAAQTKGSPVASTLASVATGHTFTGEDPLSAEGIAKAIVPFTLSVIYDDWKAGVEPETVAAGGFFSAVGIKSNPTTSFEELDEAAQEQFDGRRFVELTGQQKARLEAMFPDLAKRSKLELERRASAGDTRAQAILEFDRINTERLETEEAAYQALQTNEWTTDQFANRIEEIQRDSALRRQEAERVLGVTFSESTVPAQRALAEWYDTYRKAEVAGVVDWERREELEADLYRRIDAGEFGDPSRAREAIADRRRPTHDPSVQWYFRNKETIQQHDYWTVKDEVFERFRPTIARFAPQVQSPRDLDRAITAATRDGDQRQAQILRTLRNRLDAFTSRQRLLLRAQNPDLQQALLENGHVETAPRLGGGGAGVTRLDRRSTPSPSAPAISRASPSRRAPQQQGPAITRVGSPRPAPGGAVLGGSFTSGSLTSGFGQ